MLPFSVGFSFVKPKFRNSLKSLKIKISRETKRQVRTLVSRAIKDNCQNDWRGPKKSWILN